MRQIFLVDFRQGTDDAKVERYVAPESGCIQAHLDVAWVHVGVKKPVAKHLGKENGDAIARQLGKVDPGCAQLLDLADGHALHALHHHHVGAAVIPEHLGHQHQVQAVHIAP